jgi:hypothetical protein
MSLSYEGILKPDVAMEVWDYAIGIGLRPFNLILIDSDEDETGLEGAVFAQDVPRIGEEVVSVDGKRCLVTRVIHHLASLPVPDSGERLMGMQPNIVARRLTTPWKT